MSAPGWGDAAEANDHSLPPAPAIPNMGPGQSMPGGGGPPPGMAGSRPARSYVPPHLRHQQQHPPPQMAPGPVRSARWVERQGSRPAARQASAWARVPGPRR